MTSVVLSLLWTLRGLVQSRAALHLEVLAVLRHNRRGALSITIANVSRVDRPDDRDGWQA